MTITIGTNLPSLIARSNLDDAAAGLSNAMQKLSSGLKIQKAGDDAAGLVISNNMEAKIRGSKQALNNIQSANSFLKVAEDGMVSISDHMQRINDLLTNMANDTNDVDSRTASINEIIERLDEINRLAETTNFNGRCMLDGSVDSIVVQMGPDADENSIIDIATALTDCHTTEDALNIELPDNLNPEKEDAFNPNNENCRAYMQIVQDAIADITTKRGLLGAYQNRMESSYDSLNTRIECLEEAKTIYTDTDIAEEATNFTKQQILQQINVAMLASANSSQQIVLSLIGG